ncbi:spinster family MFS transporter [Ferruginibacter profundus]
MKFTKQYKYLVLVLLTCMHCLSVVDRQILVILQESIKKDLHLTDTQLGLLTGFTFGIFFIVMGIPIARMADKFNRKNIISASLFLWSVMTAVSGFAKNFIHLFFARIGVAIGESGGNPPAYSIIADYFPKNKRASVFSIFASGAFLGILSGYLGGGLLNHTFGWRKTLIMLGTPGVLFSLALFMFIKEPKRDGIIKNNGSSNIKQPFVTSVKLIFKSRAFVYLCLAFGANLFSFYGINNWMPSLLSRIHGMGTAEIGTWLSLIVGVSGLLGSIAGGKLIDKYGVLNIKYYLWFPAIANLISIPFLLVVFLSSNKLLVLVAYIVPSLLSSMFLGTAFALIYRVVANDVKALATSICMFIVNLLGISMGPLIIGFLSDLMAASLGTFSLRWALMLALVVSTIAIFLFLKAAKYAGQEIINQVSD